MMDQPHKGFGINDSSELMATDATVGARLFARRLRAHYLTFFLLRTFDVSVHNHVAVQVGDALQDLPAVSPGHLLRQSPVGLQLVLYRPLGVPSEMQHVRLRQAGSETND